MTNFIFDIYFTLPEIYLMTSIFLLLVYGVLLSVSKHWGYPLLTKPVGLLSIQILFLTLNLLTSFPYLNFSSWNFFLISNFYVLCSKIAIIAVCIIWILISFNYILEEKINSFEYWILILLSVLSLCFILGAHDLLTMYLVIEFQSLSFYVLASFKRSSEFSTEAGLKYFVLGAFASAFLLFGSSLIYGLTGLTNFSDFNILFSGFIFDNSFLTSGMFIGLIFLTSALFFKLSSAPFHMWSPDVYEGSPTSTTSFFSIFPKLAILTLLIRIFSITFYDFFPIWKFFFLNCAFLSLLFGSLGALVQNKWKRFLAYSSINHVGFILIGFISGENFGIFSIVMYLLIYVVTTVAIFSFLTDFRIYKYPQRNQTRYLRDIVSLGGTNPILSISILIILFSMAGIPPLSGFFAKVFVLFIGIQSETYSLMLFAVVMSSIACFYYIRVIQSMYFLKLLKWPLVIPIKKPNALILSSSCFILVFFFLDIELFSILITRMVLSFT